VLKGCPTADLRLRHARRDEQQEKKVPTRDEDQRGLLAIECATGCALATAWLHGEHEPITLHGDAYDPDAREEVRAAIADLRIDANRDPGESGTVHQIFPMTAALREWARSVMDEMRREDPSLSTHTACFIELLKRWEDLRAHRRAA
jgi:hypothetical protein